jgi:hypothetical protein
LRKKGLKRAVSLCFSPIKIPSPYLILRKKKCVCKKMYLFFKIKRQKKPFVKKGVGEKKKPGGYLLSRALGTQYHRRERA